MAGDPVVGSIVQLNDSWTGTIVTTTDYTTYPDTTHHWHWNGCGCGTVFYTSPTSTAHEHDYQQAQGEEYYDVLFCRTCGDTKRLKATEAKEG